MSGDDYRAQSRQTWVRVDGKYDDASIKLGCLQRIADATEAMAKRHTALIDEVACERTWRIELLAENDGLARQRAALRGVITRLKRRGGA